ncbi:MAG: GntR family transcriptional regulator, partial [Ktedonobacteraceae bacterium]
MTTDVLIPLLPTGSVYLDRSKSLSPQIVDDLKVRMLSGQYPQGGPLPTNSTLAEFYGASDQVIVNVLTKLIVEGYVVKEGYGRYNVASIIPPVKPPTREADVRPKEMVALTMPPPGCDASQHVLYCPTCGIWTPIAARVLEAIPAAAIALICVA